MRQTQQMLQLPDQTRVALGKTDSIAKRKS